MHRFLYLNLALQSIRKNYRITVPFIAGSSLMVCMVYSLSSLSSNPSLASSYGGNSLQVMLDLGAKIIMFFTLLFYFYLNGVWVKNRSQENGLYTVLGMEKHHLIRIIFYELLFSYAVSLAAGLILGICLEKVMFLLILRVMNAEAELGIAFNWNSVLLTIAWIGLCYLLILAYSIFYTLRSNPLEQMKGKSSAEKPIKNRWILAVLGFASLGTGYAIAVSIQNPIKAMMMFFIAVIFVIIGTYLLFIFGSTVIIGVLEKNRSFYYRPNHFITLSTLKYRLKTNAAALANIAILSTMILVTLSTTISLMAGVSSTVDMAYPREVNISVTSSAEAPLTQEQAEKSILDAAEQCGWNIQDPIVTGRGEAEFLLPDGKTAYAALYHLDTLNKFLSDKVSLGENQILVFSGNAENGEIIKDLASGKDYEVLRADFALPDEMKDFLSAVPNHLVCVSRMEGNSTIWTVSFDSSTDFHPEDSAAVEKEAQKFFSHLNNLSARLELRSQQKIDLYVLYSGLLFTGIYVSLLFILVVILIMYYKQISEGIEDRERFMILQKIGLEPSQIKKVINDQVLVMFFLPLGTALIHILFAYPMISKMLSALVYSSSTLFFTVTGISFLVFAIIYIVIYKMTARTYYRLTCLPE